MRKWEKTCKLVHFHGCFWKGFEVWSSFLLTLCLYMVNHPFKLRLSAWKWIVLCSMHRQQSNITIIFSQQKCPLGHQFYDLWHIRTQTHTKPNAINKLRMMPNTQRNWTFTHLILYIKSIKAIYFHVEIHRISFKKPSSRKCQKSFTSVGKQIWHFIYSRV